MIFIKSIVLYSTIQFLGIGDSGDIHLAILVTQSVQQLSELQNILKMANLTTKQLNQAIEMAQKMQQGIDQVLKPIEKSKQFKQSLMEIKNARSLRDLRYGAEEVRDYLDHYKKLFPEKYQAEQKRREDYEKFEKDISKANRSDLEEINRLESEIIKDSATGNFSPARAQQFSAQIQLKQWESQILLREQIQKLIDENNTLREEIARNRRKQEIQSKLDSEMIQSRWEKGWGDGL